MSREFRNIQYNLAGVYKDIELINVPNSTIFSPVPETHSG